MNESQLYAIIETLKTLLKRKGLKYVDLAQKLGVSVTTVKRIFSEKELGVGRLMEICDVLGIRFFDLVELARNDCFPEVYLTDEQEEFFAESLESFEIFQLIHRGWDFSRIRDKLGIDKVAWQKVTRDLDRLGLIDRLENERVTPRSPGIIRLKTKGPLARVVHKDQHKDFLEQTFEDPPSDQRLYFTGEFHVAQDTLREVVAQLESISKRLPHKAWRDEMFSPSESLVPLKAVVVVGRRRQSGERSER